MSQLTTTSQENEQVNVIDNNVIDNNIATQSQESESTNPIGESTDTTSPSLSETTESTENSSNEPVEESESTGEENEEVLTDAASYRSFHDHDNALASGVDALGGLEVANTVATSEVELIAGTDEDESINLEPSLDSFEINYTEDGNKETVTGNALLNADEGDGNGVFEWLNTNSMYGTLTADSDGDYSFTIDRTNATIQALGAGEQIAEVFNYSYTDSNGDIAYGSLTVNITGINDAPTVEASTNEVKEDTIPSVKDFLATPSDIDTNDVLEFIPFTSQGIYGSLVVETDGSYTYTLDDSPEVDALAEGEIKEEVFTYTVQDNNGGIATNTLTITIEGTNDAPTVEAEVNSIDEDTTEIQGSIDTLEDVDTESEHVFTVENGTGQYGTLVMQTDGTYSYTLDNTLSEVQSLAVGESLSEEFTFTVDDNEGGVTTSTVTIIINGTNDTPSVESAVGEIAEDDLDPLVGVLPTPVDVDNNNELNFTEKTVQGTYGIFTLLADGSYTYELDSSLDIVQSLGLGDSLQEVIPYEVVDEYGAKSESEIVITINGTNDIPTVESEINTISEGTSQIQGLIDTVEDIDLNSAHTFSVENGTGQYGTLVMQSDGTYSYSLDNTLSIVQSLAVGESLSEEFTFTVDDNEGGIITNTITITIDGTNSSPQVSSTTGKIEEDASENLTGTLPSPTDVDNGSSVSFVEKTVQGTYGIFTLLADGSYTYELDNSLDSIQALSVGETLQEKIYYTVIDEYDATAIASITITIEGTNDTPVAKIASNTVQEDVILETSGIIRAPDDVDQSDTYTFISQDSVTTSYGTFTLNANGTYSYILNNELEEVQRLSLDSTLEDIITYEVQDQHGASSFSTVTITIKGSNDSPIVEAEEVVLKDAISISGTLPEGENFDTNDTVEFLAKPTTPGMYGSLVVNSDGTYTYTLNADDERIASLGEGETVTDTFLYTVTDQHGAIGQNTFTIIIEGTNDIPIVSDTYASVKEDTSTEIAGNLSSAVYDIDTNDTFLFQAQTVVGTYGTFTIYENGDYTFVLTQNDSDNIQGLTEGESLTETFTYIVEDSAGAEVEGSIIIKINGTNDIPSLESTAISVTEDVLIKVEGQLASIKDVDNDIDGIRSEVLSYQEMQDVLGSYGVFNLNSDGSYSYELDNDNPFVQALNDGDILTETFSVLVYDENGGYSTSAVTVTINGTDESSSSSSGKKLIVIEDSILKVEGELDDDYTYTLISEGTNEYGTLTLDKDGEYQFVLDNDSPYVQALDTGESVELYFDYSYQDKGTTKTGTITITVEGRDDELEEKNYLIEVTEDNDLYLTGTFNTSEDNPYGGYTYLEETIEGTYGTLTVYANGTYTYVLNNDSLAVQSIGQDEIESESFNIIMYNRTGSQEVEHTVTLAITGINDIPIASVTQNNVQEDGTTTASGSLLYSDIDSSDTQTISAGTYAGLYGSLTIYEDGSYVYTLDNPNSAVQALEEGANLTDTFSYTVEDSQGKTATSSLVITIDGTNDIAEINSIVEGSVQEEVQQVVVGNMPVPNDIDEGDSIYFIPIENVEGQYGSLYMTAGGAYTYTLNSENAEVQALGENESLIDTFTYITVDESGAEQQHTLQITVNGTNDEPLLLAENVTISAQSATLEGVLEASDVDVNDVLTYTTSDAQGTYGVLTLDPSGSYVYTLDTESTAVLALVEGESYVEYFEITVQDSSGASSTNLLSIVIEGTNDAPFIYDTTKTISEDAQEITGWLSSVIEYDRFDSASYIAQDEIKTLYGTFTLTENGKYTYVLDSESAVVQALAEGETLEESILIYAEDSFGAISSSEFTVQIQGANDAPVIEAFIEEMDSSVTQLAGNLEMPTDIDNNDSATYVAQDAVLTEYGTFSLDEKGEYQYTLDNTNPLIEALEAGESLQDTIIISAEDTNGAIVESTLIINIVGTNDEPTAYPLSVDMLAVDTAVISYLSVSEESDEDTQATLTNQSHIALYTQGEISEEIDYNYTDLWYIGKENAEEEDSSSFRGLLASEDESVDFLLGVEENSSIALETEGGKMLSIPREGEISAEMLFVQESNFKDSESVNTDLATQQEMLRLGS